MYVGFLRGKETPSLFAKLLSKSCNQQGLTLVYFKPEDLSIEKKLIKGKVLIENKWESIKIGIPKFIDVNPHLFNNKKYKEEMLFLKRETTLSIERRHIMRKDKLQSELNKKETLKRFSIKGEKISSFNQFVDFIEQNKKVVVKPVGGLQGKSVIFIEKKTDGHYIVGSQKDVESIMMEQLKELYENQLKQKNYIIQNYIKSRTKQGEPFDCRVHLEKKSKDHWVIANTFIRIGIGQSIVSNINQGGGISRTKDFLSANFGEQGIDIFKDIKDSSILIAKELEKMTSSTYMTMGLDVGIDPNGKIVVFEVNSYPIIKPSMAEIIMIRPLFYKDMLIKSSHNLTSDNEKLKVEIEKIHSSSSWKITAPLRKVRKIIKKK